MLTRLRDRILRSKELLKSVKEILVPYRIPYRDRDTSILDELLTADPIRSKQLNDDLTNRINSVLKVSFSVSSGTSFDVSMIPNINQILGKVFAYDTEISGNKGRAYKVTHEQGRYTCTYCNRSYILTVVKSETDQPLFPDIERINGKDMIARPHLDHWFDKADNPLLSLNIFNLIPSCPLCNSSVKGKERYSFPTHVHPYLYEKAEPPFRFVISPNDKSQRFPFVVRINELLCDDKERKMIESLALKEVYSYHGMLEAKDILDWSIENSPTM